MITRGNMKSGQHRLRTALAAGYPCVVTLETAHGNTAHEEMQHVRKTQIHVIFMEPLVLLVFCNDYRGNHVRVLNIPVSRSRQCKVVGRVGLAHYLCSCARVRG